MERMSEETKQTFRVTGMDCPSCAETIDKGVSQVGGVSSCSVNYNTGRLTVNGDASRAAVVERVRDLGYDVGTEETSTAGISGNFLAYLWRGVETRCALLAAFLILPGFFLSEVLRQDHPIVGGLSVSAAVLAGWPVALKAWRTLTLNREISINTLMTVAAIGAVCIGAYAEAGMVMVLYAIGEALEGYTASRSRRAIAELMEVAPSEATRLNEGREEQVAVDALAVGDRIVVKPGERIPMDGTVRRGASLVNQAPITGESQLVKKAEGDEVFASTVNGEAVLELEVTRPAEDTLISRLIHMVEEAQEKRAPVQRFVDRFSKVYTPAVMVLAAGTAIVPPLFFGQPFLNPDGETFGWLYRGLALLVVACPCALVISTPVSIVSAVTNGARHGVLVKGGVYLEVLARVRAVAFDKTGTLTEGRPTVERVWAEGCTNGEGHGVQEPCDACADMVGLAHAVERRSEHPIAHAIGEAAERVGVADRYEPAGDVTADVGRGIHGRVNGSDVRINAAESAVSLNGDSRASTVIEIWSGENRRGVITLADTVRPSAREAIDGLRALGITRLVLLTGDKAGPAQHLGKLVGVDDVRFELLPDAKLTVIEELKREEGLIAMIGDGINDAPALARADVGIAVGGELGGTAQAMETADITIMSGDLRGLPYAFRLARAAMNTVRVNIGLSLVIKAVFLVLVLIGLGTMWMAVLADVGASLLVTLNGMRLLGFRDKPAETG